MTQTHDPMAQIKASFFAECDELLEQLQDGLNAMEANGEDKETVNVVFRAVHSIKGGAGAFSLTALVAYAHRFETVMDEVRSGRLGVSAEAMKLFFQAADILSDQVRAAAQGAAEPAGAEAALRSIEALIPGGVKDTIEEDVADFQPLGLALQLDLADFAPDLPDLSASGADLARDTLADDLPVAATSGADADAKANWRVSFRPHAALYVSGNEPLMILRALAGLGPAAVTCDSTDLPELAVLVPGQGYLGWRIALPGSIAEEDIREVFDFVLDVADIEILRGGPDSDCAASCDATAAGIAGSTPAGSGLPAVTDVAAALQAPPLAAGAAESAPPSVAATAAAAAVAPPKVAAGELPRTAQPKAVQAAAPTVTTDPAAATVRVELDRVERLVNLVGELVITQAMLAQSVTEAGFSANSTVMSALETFMMLTHDIQDSVMMIRAQPVKPLFQRMSRIVREAALAVGKDVRLKFEGEGTEVDKTVIERLADPLTHMIRNAVDHGLESPDDRAAAGKSREGIIVLSALHRSGRVVIEISDDGAGINRTRVQQIAAQRGLIAADAQLTETEIDNLLFLPGFSTAATVSSLSGRGVGMDVVKRAIQGLGGRIFITSERGKGTKFSISLPLTLAVLDGMVVRAAGETLVVPLSSIVETATLARDDIRMVSPGSNVIYVRGEFIPLYDLSAELGFRRTEAPPANGIVLLTTTEDGRRAALIVDGILEQRQVVIKGLQRTYGAIPGIAAATILGDGRIALILDPADLVAQAATRPRGAEYALAG